MPVHYYYWCLGLVPLSRHTYDSVAEQSKASEYHKETHAAKYQPLSINLPSEHTYGALAELAKGS